ncbi:MAG: class I tRNA ligase family protein [Thermodesulfobacteriota bacterium]
MTMLTLYNSLGKKMEVFRPVNPGVVTVFTCGPSVYQRSHIGNFRTFLFEDILVRYLEYLGWPVERGMTVTDIEDKAIREAGRKGITLERLTRENIEGFLREMRLLCIRMPDHLPRASEHVEQAAAMIGQLLAQGVAYRHGRNVYFDPLKFPGFGKIYGLDMGRWPAQRRRFHRDTYAGNRWNLGDFILWHGFREGDPVSWDTPIGRGRPAWNIQDPSMVGSRFEETLSVYCGGIDNLYRHHDYSLAVLESLRPYPMARCWLHGGHLLVGGRKMSKSLGNVLYTDDLLDRGYSPADVRFFLISGHYREKLSYSEGNMKRAAAARLHLRERARMIAAKAGGTVPGASVPARRIGDSFRRHMDRDLDVKGAIGAITGELAASDAAGWKPASAAAVVKALREIDAVLKVLFEDSSG